MGNTDSKLNVLYREHVFKLGQEERSAEGVRVPREIPLFSTDKHLQDLVLAYNSKTLMDDDVFAAFYLDFVAAGSSLTSEMLNSVITPLELRALYKKNPTNFVNLLRFASLQICLMANSLQGPNSALLEYKLNRLSVCIKILTKCMPIYLERQSKKLHQDIYWSNDPQVVFGLVSSTSSDKCNQPLGAFLLDSCMKLMFIEGFTIPSMGSPGNLTHVIWENGINTQDTTYHIQTPKLDSNRLDIIHLVLSCCSSDLYLKPSQKPLQNYFLYSFTTLTPEYIMICFVASIVNVVCRYCINYKEETTLPYKNISHKHSQQQQLPQLKASLVISALQLLNLLSFDYNGDGQAMDRTFEELGLLSNGQSSRNVAKSYLSTLSRETDSKIILSSTAKIFKYAVDAAIDQELTPFGSFSTRRQQTTAVNRQLDQQPRSANDPNSRNSTKNENRTTDDGGNNNVDDIRDSRTQILSLPQLPPLLLQVLVFFMNMITHNKSFQNYVADKFANKFVIFSIYYLNYYHHIPEMRKTFLPLCSSLALFLTSKKLVLFKMLETFGSNYYTNKLPTFFKLSDGNVNKLTYRDFAIIHLCNMAIADIRNNRPPRTYVYELIYNLVPIDSDIKDEELTILSSKRHQDNSTFGETSTLSYNASMAILHLISKSSNKLYLSTYASAAGKAVHRYAYSPGLKLDLLSLLLRCCVQSLGLHFCESRNLAFAICRHHRVLSQIKEALDSLTKVLDGQIRMEGIGEVELQDYFEFDLRPSFINMQMIKCNKGSAVRSNQIVTSERNDNADRISAENIRNSNGNNSMTDLQAQYIILDRRLKAKAIAEMQSENVEDDSDDESDVSNVDNAVKGDQQIEGRSKSGSPIDGGTISRAASQDMESSKPQRSRTENAGRSYEVYENVNLAADIVSDYDNVLRSLKCKWPAGISSKAKAKSSVKSNMRACWSGTPSLQFLMRITKLLLNELPNIIDVGTSGYYAILDEMVLLEPKIDRKLKALLPCDINGSSPHMLRVDLSDSNKELRFWLYVLCWADIFNSHTSVYNVTLNISDNSSALRFSNSSGMDVESSSNPALERWTSNGTNLSRTSSNSSSMMNFLSQQSIEETSPQTQENSEMYSHANSPVLGSPRIKRSSSAGSTGNKGIGFFRLPWSGFGKSDNDYAAIKEEDSTNDDPQQKNAKKCSTFILDTGLLKPNMWAGSKIKLFPVTKNEKEEFSFLDMTSSLLKRLRLNSIGSVSSSETMSAPNGHVSSNNSNNLFRANSNSTLATTNSRTKVKRTPVYKQDTYMPVLHPKGF